MGRGPSYPYVGLEEAIGLTRKVYEYAKRGPAPVEALTTEAFKYSATSSSGIKVMAALKSFGLIEDASGTNGKSVKLTQRAIRILLDDPESSERKEEIKNAAIEPKWYEYCWKKWGPEMPPAMKHHLLVEHGFVDSTVDGFLKDYRATVSFAGLLDDKIFSNQDKSEDQSKPLHKAGDYVQWESQGVLRMPTARKFVRYSDDGKFGFVEGSLTGIPSGELIAAESPILPVLSPDIAPAKINSSQGEVKMQTDIITLADGITIQLQWPSVISKDAYDDFEYQLEGFKRRVKRAIQDESRQGTIRRTTTEADAGAPTAGQSDGDRGEGG
jgi:hypothetical protein